MLDFDVKIHKKGDGSFQTKYLDPKTGKRKRKIFSTLKEAKLYKSEVEGKVQSKGTSAFSDLRISQGIKLYLEKFPNSPIRDRKNHFTSFVESLGTYRVSELTTNDLKSWFDSRQKEGNLSEKTLNGMKSQFYGFFEFLVSEDLIRQNPLLKIKFKRFDVPRRARIVMSVDEVKEILDHAKKFDTKTLYPYLYTLAHTGPRKSEILSLRKEDVDFKTGLLHIRKTKNGHERFIRMSENLMEVLKMKMESHNFQYVFPNGSGEPIGPHELSNSIGKFQAYFPADKDWGCHSFRHSFAYNFLKAGGEMYQLQAILGHRGIQVTVDLYGQLQAQDIENPSPYNF
ncbi:MAG: site-specific integrase [Bacteriovoracaceae bacterium]|nr:site-specific integrase [Bacteriovoracaceae bacterium]